MSTLTAPDGTLAHDPTQSPRILVCDDDPALVKSLEVRLHSQGYRVISARDGASAIALFDEQGADLILLDIMMPKLDGFGVCEIIKKSSEVPVIFITGAQDQMIREYLPNMVNAVGGDYYVRKPFDARSLLVLISKALY